MSKHSYKAFIEQMVRVNIERTFCYDCACDAEITLDKNCLHFIDFHFKTPEGVTVGGTLGAKGWVIWIDNNEYNKCIEEYKERS